MIEWTNDEQEKLRAAHDEAEVAATSQGAELTSMECQRLTSVAVADKAVELVAERGGTMTAGAPEDDLLTVSGMLPDTARRLRQHIAAQLASVAAIERDRDVAHAMLQERETMLAGFRERQETHRAALARLEAENAECRRLLTTLVAASRLGEAKAEITKLKATAEEDWIQALIRAHNNEERRLKPSGQVAEDVRLVDDGALGKEQAEALSRLAAGAQARMAAEKEAEALRTRVAALERELENSQPIEALRADLSDQLRAAWEATGVATVRGMTTLADVVGVTKNDLREALQSLSSARAEADRLAPLEHEVKRLRAEAADAERSARNSLGEVDRLRAEVTGGQERSRMLLDAKNHWADRARAAESRLAAIRELVCHPQSEDDVANIPERVRQILDGAAPNHSVPLKSSPNSPGIPDGSVGTPQDEALCRHDHGWHIPIGGGQLTCTSCNEPIPMGLMATASGGTPPEAKGTGCFACDVGFRPPDRHPCSPTCTHDDAATPGHPERVRAQSEAENVASGLSLYGKRVEWEAAFEHGVEAMRAALLREAKQACDQHGVDWLYQHLKHRFDGATP